MAPVRSLWFAQMARGTQECGSDPPTGGRGVWVRARPSGGGVWARTRPSGGGSVSSGLPTGGGECGLGPALCGWGMWVRIRPLRGRQVWAPVRRSALPGAESQCQGRRQREPTLPLLLRALDHLSSGDKLPQGTGLTAARPPAGSWL